jgi:Kef-type K+ transport system membrane component KefB
LLVLAAGVGFIGVLLRQPLIVSFIAVGILAGPAGLGVVRSTEQIHFLAELGIAVLLFLVGIKLDVKLIRTLGPVSLATGLGQIAFTFLLGFLLSLVLGLNMVTSTYVAIALSFSSTIIIVKMLSDKREIDSLHGRIALGCLIVQDLVVVIAMIALSALGAAEQEDAGFGAFAQVVSAGAAMLGSTLLFIRFLANPLTDRLARSPELLIGFSIALAAAYAAVGNILGLGKELGGLLAGIALASTPFRDAIAARLAPLRDFLLLFFFIGLGSGLDLQNLGQSILQAAVLSAFVLIGKPLLVLGVTSLLGYRRRTGGLAGLTLAQISEFSLIFMAMGVAIGHVSTEALGLVTLVGLITIAASTYMITYSHPLYARLEPFLGMFGGKGKHELDPEHSILAEDYDTIIFGIGRYGGTMGRRLADQGKKVLGVDFNPSAIRRWRNDGLDATFGEASDPEFIAHLPLDGVQWVISTVRDPKEGVTHSDERIVLIQTLREAGYEGRIAVASNSVADFEALKAAGADLVLEPFHDAADRAVELLDIDAFPAVSPALEMEEQREFWR